MQIRSWLTTLGVLILLSTVSEMALPKGSMRKYLRFIAGLLIIQAMIAPVAQWLRAMPGTLDASARVAALMDATRAQHAATRDGEYKRITLESYRREVQRNIIRIASENGVEQPSVRVDVSGDGKIERIIVYDGVAAASGLGMDGSSLPLRVEIARVYGLSMEQVLVR